MIHREREIFVGSGYTDMTDKDIIEQMEITQEECIFELNNNFVDFLIDN
jgi:hypothetical protein